MGRNRRLRASKDREGSFSTFFNDDTDASVLMRGHTFYLLLVVGVTLCAHKMLLVLCDTKVPASLRFPKVEIKVFLILIMVIASKIVHTEAF